MNHATTGYAPVNGLKMYYEVHGTGRPLVLLPGGLMTIEGSFGAVLPELAAGRQVIATELQGHGRTADIDRDITMAALAGDVAGLLGHLGVDQADVLGFSLGGGTALQLALDYPDRVRPAHRGLGRLLPRRVPRRDLGPGPVGHLDPDAHGRGLPADARGLRAAGPDRVTSRRSRPDRAGRGEHELDPAELGRIGAPTLLVFGDHDFIRLEHAVEMHALIPGAQLAVLPGATHMGVLRRADLMVPLVSDFLASRDFPG